MKIIQLRIENFKGIASFEVTPNGHGFDLVGANESGKSSAIDALFCALGGAKAAPDKPIRTGAKKALVEVKIGDYLVRRSFTEKGSALTVGSADGKASFKNPQDLLSGFFSALSFDPLEFSRSDGKKQAATIKKLVPGLDVSDLEAADKREREERTAIGRARDMLAGQLAGIAVPPEPPAAGEEIPPATLRDQRKAALATITANRAAREDVARLADDLERDRALLASLADDLATAGQAPARAREAMAGNDAARVELDALAQSTETARSVVRDLEAQLAAARKALAAADAAEVAQRRMVANFPTFDLAALDAAPAALKAQLAEEAPPVAAAAAALDEKRATVAALIDPDPAALDAEEERIEQHNRAVRVAKQALTEHATAAKQRATKAADHAAEESRYNDRSDKIDYIAREKAARLAAAKLPIVGLALDGDTVTLDGIPLAQVNTARRVEVGLAIAEALGTEARFLVIRDAVLVKGSTKLRVEEWARAKGLQLIREIATDEGAMHAVIEDGAPVEQQPELFSANDL